MSMVEHLAVKLPGTISFHSKIGAGQTRAKIRVSIGLHLPGRRGNRQRYVYSSVCCPQLAKNYVALNNGYLFLKYKSI